MMKYQVLLADADGTLFDFHAGERLALTTVLQGVSIPADEETLALYSRINEGHWKRLERGETTQQRLRVERFADFLTALGRRDDPEEMCRQFMEQLGQQRILLPGALALCQAVSQSMPILLVTNGISTVQRSRFTDCSLSPYIAGMVISEEVGHAKPEPHMLQEAMRQAGVANPRQALMLGDSLTADIAAAQNAGIDSLWYTGGKEPSPGHGATYVAKTLAEAQRLVLQ